MTQPSQPRHPAPRSGARVPAWRQQGEEPDYRFTLANERTFLAWIRTALAVLAAGVLLEQFASRLQPQWVVSGLAVMLCSVAAALCALAYRHWRCTEVSMRHQRPLPHSRTLAVLVGVILAVSLVLLLMIAGLRAGMGA